MLYNCIRPLSEVWLKFSGTGQRLGVKATYHAINTAKLIRGAWQVLVQWGWNARLYSLLSA